MSPKRKSAFGDNSATGRKSATVQAKHTVQAPTTQKRTRRPRAAATVHEVLNHLITRGRPESRSPDPSPSTHISVVGTGRIEVLERDNASLKLSVDAISDSLDEDKEMLQALAQGQGTVRGIASSTPAHIGSISGPRLFVATQRSIHCGFGCWDTFRRRHHEAYGPQ
jgi:hypothetical protein